MSSEAKTTVAFLTGRITVPAHLFWRVIGNRSRTFLRNRGNVRGNEDRDIALNFPELARIDIHAQVEEARVCCAVVTGTLPPARIVADGVSPARRLGRPASWRKIAS